MGFRFYNSNPMCKPYLLSGISSWRYKTCRLVGGLLFQSLNSSQQPCAATLHDNPNHRRIPRRWHFGHSSSSDSRHQQQQQQRPYGEDGEFVFRLGLAADVFLATGKALTGYLSGSTAVIADAAHSFSDIVLSGVALLSFKAGKAPKDKEHPYGHGKFESLGALGISCMLLATSGGIAWHAFDVLIGVWSVSPEAANHPLPLENMQNHVHGGGGRHHGIDMEHPILALSMTALSISVKEGLYWITKRAGEKQGSGLMKANAWHHRADAISSVVALIGVGGSILGVKFLDPLAGLLVSGMIFKAGLETGYQSVLELVDAALPVEHLNSIKETILQVKGVEGVHRLRGRRAGSYVFLDVHIEVDPFCSVSAAHGIGERVRRKIHNSYPQIAEIYVHIDPAKLSFSLSTIDRHENLEGTARQNQNICLEDKDIEVIVSEVLSSRFSEKMEVERITYHSLQGRIILQIEVVMPHDMLIRDAMELAKEAEKEIFKGVPDSSHVSFQLRLGRPIPKLGLE